MADAFTPLGLVKVEVGQSVSTWGQKLNTNFDTIDTKLTANTTAIAAAQAAATAALAKTGGTTSGSITSPAFVLDANGYLTLVGGNPVSVADASDYTVYDRAANTYNWIINDVNRFAITATDTVVFNNLSLTNAPTAAVHATTKGYVDNQISTRLSLTGGNIGGDLMVYRPATPTTGVLYLGNTGTRYVYHDGANYVMPNSDLYVNGGRVYTSAMFDPATFAPKNTPTFTGTVRATNQIISQATGNPTVAVYDINQGCAGLMYGGGNGLYFANLDGNGNYIGSWRGMMDASGNFTAAGNVAAYSDVSLKSNIRTVQDALATVTALRGVNYTRVDQPDTAKVHLGLIAQEVRKEVPEVVGEVEGKLTVDYGALVALLIEAVKELTARVDEIAEEII